MKLHKPLLLLSFIIFSQGLFAQCPPGENEIRLEIDPDQYFYEISWTITDLESGFTYVSGDLPLDSAFVFTYCIPDDGCKVFEIIDDYGDGMQPDGYYKVYFNGDLIGSNIGERFFTSEKINFGCPPGTTCESGIPIDLGAWQTADGKQTWYKFIPQDTGIYKINTCDTLNACTSKIWVYSTCQNIQISDNVTGADFYADGGCANGAEASLYLAGGQDYYIRIRYEPEGCDTTAPIHFTLSYQGPIVGCMDPVACNYNPLATVSDTCIYPGDPNCAHAPDLVTNQDEFRSSMSLGSIDNPDACLVQEGCIRGLGTRYIINFTTFVENIGDLDYHIGPVPADTSAASNQFVWDPCHHHWHYLGYAEYVLFNSSGYRIPIGSKTGFCVLDLICPPEESKYTCVNMGISAGCGDVYEVGLPCQWIDITDIPADDYTMVLRVNWDKSPDGVGRLESDYSNNWAQACFTLSYSNNGIPEVVYHNDQCDPYTDCAGEVFGNAQPDCNGVCNGPSLQGDWNQDTLRNGADIQGYLDAANNDSGTPDFCLDLDGNASINVYDAALLQECNIHQNDPQYWIQRFPCQFPGGFLNTQDIVSLKPGTLDTVAKTFDIEILNPANKIIAYEFSVSGLTITQVENLSGSFNPDIRFNPATGEIIALGLDESAIAKNPIPTAFLRIHYSAVLGTEVCLENITAIVNSKYQQSNAMIASPNCIMVKTSGLQEATKVPFAVFVQPNPFNNATTIYFENEDFEPSDIQLKDIAGKTVRHFEGVRSNSVSIERNKLPAGTYIFSVQNSRGVVSGKIIAQ